MDFSDTYCERYQNLLWHLVIRRDPSNRRWSQWREGRRFGL